MILVDVASCVVSSLVVDGEDERALFPSRGAADGLTPPFRCGLAHRAFPWLLLDVERPSFRPAELLLPGAESAPRLECVVLGNSMAQAYYAATSSLPRHFGPLEGNG